MSPLSRKLRLHGDYWRAYVERGCVLVPQQVEDLVGIVAGFEADALDLEARLQLHALKARRLPGSTPGEADAERERDDVVVPLRRPGAR